MMTLDLIRTAETVPCQPWPRHVLSHEAWSGFFAAQTNAPLTLLALWADTVQVHALLLDNAALNVIAVSTSIEEGRYPAVSPQHACAAPYERIIADLWGHAATGARDLRPWLDKGHWSQTRPMAVRPEPPRPQDSVAMLPEADDDLMQLSLGPIHGRLDEAAQLRLQIKDGSVVAAEAQLGFTHKGTLMLMRGKAPRTAARFAARLSGDATVAHALAFSAATEAALGVKPPARAVALRAALLEMERIASHLDTLAEVGRLTGAAVVWTRCGVLREQVSRAAASAFGHRLMMDCVVPGGVALDITDAAQTTIRRALGEIATELPSLRRLHNEGAFAARLTGVGRVAQPLLRHHAAGGPAARAAGCSFDARAMGQDMPFKSVSRGGGDALARQHLRIEEIAMSLDIIGTRLRTLPEGQLTVALPQESGEGIGFSESARGDIWHWLRLDHGQIAACFLRDPGWALWPVAEAALVHAPAEDVGLIKASFALPASGVDL
ncbi:MAG: hydrogenase expression protein HypE [Rhodopila sp.]